jgi:hypothetical protein
MSRAAVSVARLVVAIVMLGLCACATFKPGSLEQIPVRERAQTLEENGLRVSVAVLSRAEAKDLFGANLHERGVQPVWIEVENKTDLPFWLMFHGLDPNYFSAHEVAYMNHKSFSGKSNREMDAYFASMQIDQNIRAGQTNSGFAFSNETIGTKEVRVRLYGNKDLRDFEFFATIPGLQSEWDSKDLTKLWSADQLIHIETEDELQKAIEALPCCTQREIGIGDGEPVNVVLIGGIASLKALLKAGWDETVFVADLSTYFRASQLYGRPPDVQFIKSRRRVKSTNKLRLWLSPIRYRGEAVAVGSIKRSIDPDTDEAALYLAEDLATAGTVKRFGFVGGVGKVPREKPKRTFADDTYWTEGKRLVLELTETPTPLDSLTIFSWDWGGPGVFTPQNSPATDAEVAN